jgi:hypothetical protein
VLLGAVRTYADHLRFQTAYAQIYELRSRITTPVVNYPEKPLNDWRRDIRIGDYLDAPYRLDPKTGTLVPQPQ